MSRTSIILISVFILVIAAILCVLLIAYAYLRPPSPNIMETSVAQTIPAALTGTAQSQSLATVGMTTGTPMFTPSATFIPGIPTSTPTATMPAMILFTPTPVIPQISVSVDTNCRVGPGKVYDRVGYLLVGQVSEVYGRNPTGDYWYIRNLNQPSGFCWLWGEYATVSGNLSALPIYTPPPTPTPVPSFEASYRDLDTCSGWWVDIDLYNNGGITFKSMTFTIRDMATDIVMTLYADGFTDNEGCVDSITKNHLNPGYTRTVSSPAFNYDPAGHKLRATITLCSNTGQNGTCVTQVIEFKP